MLPSYEEDEDGKLERIDHLPFEDEQEMHDWLEKHPNTIQEDMFIVGSKLHYESGKETDLLGIDKDNHIVIIEIKQKSEKPRSVVAQIIDYAARAHAELGTDELNKMAKRYGTLGEFSSLRKKFEKEFGHEFDDVSDEQKLYIVSEKIHDDTKRMAKYLREYQIDLNCIELRKQAKVNGKTRYQVEPIIGGKMSASSHKLDHAAEKNYDWSYYSNYKDWDDKVIEQMRRIHDKAFQYSQERGWQMQPEFNMTGIVFRRAPRGVKFGDRRILELKQIWPKKLRVSFNWLKDPDKKPDANFDWEYDKSFTRWYFQIDPQPELDLSSNSDFEKILVQAYNATTER